MSAPTRRTTRAAAALATGLLVCVGLSSCSGNADSQDAKGSPTSGSESSEPAAEPRVKLTTNVKNRTAVPVDKDLRFEAVGGTLEKMVVRSGKGAPLAGDLTKDNTAWVAKARLEPGTTYTAKAVAKTPSGTTHRATASVRTLDLTLDQQTFAAIAPLDGETVGVGMPVIVTFDVGRDRQEGHPEAHEGDQLAAAARLVALAQ